MKAAIAERDANAAAKAATRQVLVRGAEPSKPQTTVAVDVEAGGSKPKSLIDIYRP